MRTEYRIIWLPQLNIWRVFHVGWRLSPALVCDFTNLSDAITHYADSSVRIG